MTHAPLWQLRFRVAEPAEETVFALVESIFQEAPVAYTDADTGITQLSLYRPARRRPRAIELDRLQAGLRALRTNGVLDRVPRVSLRRIPAEDWTQSWKRHFKARVFGGRLLVRPSWSSRRPRPGEVEVVLDPGLSFGTGQHATTAFCLEQVVAAVADDPPARSLLDAGTGSGILAIAAAKLGFARIQAFDFDPESIRTARDNAAANGMSDRVRPVRRDVARLPLPPRRPYDLVTANLLADLLLEQRDRLVAQTAPGGRLVLAGILERQFPAIRRAYHAAGLRLLADRIEGEWRSGAFRRPG